MTDRILLIRTGGTIDAEPYDAPKSPPSLVSTLSGADSLIFSTIANFPNQEHVDGFTWTKQQEGRFVKDSQLFTAEDMSDLAQLIKEGNQHGYFILTHGTDTMVENATLLQQELQDSGKTVLLVGSMVPLSMHKRYGSDGVDALHFALEHIYECPSGVSIVGTDSATRKWNSFSPTQVQKDRIASLETSVFTLTLR